MAYRLGVDEPVGGAVARCALEQVDRAIRELTEGIDEGPVEAIHSARKAIKKERSLLRLARGTIPPGKRTRENAALRDVARSLSGARDAAVMARTLDELSERFVGQLPAPTFDKLREQLESESNGRFQAHVGSASDDGVVQQLRAIQSRIANWKLGEDGWAAVESGLVRCYKRGRKAFARAQAERSLGNLHAWRKRVKDLWYHDRLLSDVCGPTVGGHAKDSHQLADLLGDDHDLGLLRRRLTGDSVPVPADLDAVVRLIDHRREELQTEAMELGERVYAESPKGFKRRMRRSWTAGRAAAEAKRASRPAELAAATREPRAS